MEYNIKRISLIIAIFFSITSFSSTGVPFPKLSGSFSVGQAQWTFKDFSRSEVLAPKNDPGSSCTATGLFRSIPLIVHYPSDINEASSKKEKATYIPSSVVKSMGLPSAIGDLKKRAFKNSKVSSVDERFPVIIFSPGLGISSIFYTALLEEIASHGYIIFAMSHPYVSGRVYISENDCVIPMPPLPTTHGELAALLGVMIDENIKDFNFLLPIIKKMDNVEGLFKGKIDTDNIIYMGHSAGGMLVTAYCSKIKSNCKAAINLDGGDIDGIGIEVAGAWPSKPDMPFLKIHSASFPDLDKIPLSAYGKDQYLLDIAKIDHKTFSDMAFFPGQIQDPTGMLIPPKTSQHLINKNILSFLDSIKKDEKMQWPIFSSSLEELLERTSSYGAQFTNINTEL